MQLPATLSIILCFNYQQQLVYSRCYTDDVRARADWPGSIGYGYTFLVSVDFGSGHTQVLEERYKPPLVSP